VSSWNSPGRPCCRSEVDLIENYRYGNVVDSDEAARARCEAGVTARGIIRREVERLENIGTDLVISRAGELLVSCEKSRLGATAPTSVWTSRAVLINQRGRDVVASGGSSAERTADRAGVHNSDFGPRPSSCGRGREVSALRSDDEVSDEVSHHAGPVGVYARESVVVERGDHAECGGTTRAEIQEDRAAAVTELDD